MYVFRLFIFIYSSLSVLSFYIEKGRIYNNITNGIVSIQGISWFGFETETAVLQGLDRHSIDFYLDILKNHGINSVRVPFSEEWIYYNYDFQPDPIMLVSEPSMVSKKSIEILDELFRKTDIRNITILLDMHRLNTKSISPIWYSHENDRYTSQTFYNTWVKILDRYNQYENLIGVDILNEPHDLVTYGDNNASSDWFRFSNETIFFLNNKFKNHNWLIFVQGINWGRIFPKFNNKTLLFSGKNVVYSPHVYGRSITADLDMNPIILEAYWEQSFGYLKNIYNQTVVIGEWGGRTSLDEYWMSLFSKYLCDYNMTDNYFWSLTPNSDDVDGFLLTDWTTIDPIKKILLENIQNSK